MLAVVLDAPYLHATMLLRSKLNGKDLSYCYSAAVVLHCNSSSVGDTSAQHIMLRMHMTGLRQL